MKTFMAGWFLIFFLLSLGCASAPTGPSEPGRPWISQVSCPSGVASGDPAKIIFRYQGDQLPAYAEVTLTKISGMGGGGSDFTIPVDYRYENEYEIPLKLSPNPTSWSINFYVVDRKGRWSNELECQITVF